MALLHLLIPNNTALSTPVFRDNQVAPDDDMDADTAALIARLALEDLEEAQGRSKGKSRTGAPLSDQDYAYKLQSEDFQELLLVSEDEKYARSVARALSTDTAYLDAFITAEVAAAQDRHAAEMISRGEALPPQTPMQRRMENPAFVMHPEPPATGPSLTAIVEQEKVPERLARRLRPKYLRYNVWEDNAPLSRSTANWTETATPLPSPPQSELDDPIVKKTIAKNPHLFKIVTPVNVDRFEELLRNHPNPAFVASVCRGLREGFWPWADTHKEGFPSTHDASLPPPKDPKKAEFLRTQCETEVLKGRFSPAFGPDLLPGMYSMPIHAVPKPNSTDMRMITDQSAGDFPLNAMIDRSDISGYPLDNMSHLGQILLRIRQDAKDKPLTLFKSDVAEAYRLLPVHPHWQIKQVNTVNGSTRHVDRNNAFGGRASGSIWIAFNGLVTWIAVNVKGLTWLRVYSDDSFSPEWSDKLTWDTEFRRQMPTSQVTLLNLWRELGIPYKPAKQISGTPLTIIGIEVDPNAMTLTLPQTARDKLLDEIADFCHIPPGASGVKHPLRRWQQLAGWMNWAFNVYPLLRPALNNVYPLIAGREDPDQTIWTNSSVRGDLEWAARHMHASDGVHLLRSLDWDITEADAVIYCHACADGISFWYPATRQCFGAPVTSGSNDEFVSFNDARCILSALNNAVVDATHFKRIAIFTEDTNAMDMFNSLRGKPAYNGILKASVDLRFALGHQLRVFHVSSEENTVAAGIFRRQSSRRALPKI